MRNTRDAMIEGAVAGALAAASMTLFRMLMRRAGLIEHMVPQVVEEWLRRKTRIRPPFGTPGHHVLDQTLHLGYGATWGALWSLVSRRVRPSRAVVPFAIGQWAFGAMALFPLLGIGRPAWRSKPRENAINLGAHLLYATVTAFLGEELARQQRHHPFMLERMRAEEIG